MTEYEQKSESAEPILPNPVPTETRHRTPRHQRPSLFWPIVLVGAGILLLLSNLGLFPASGWAILWRFWPLALIALGVDVMIGRRSTGGAIASGILLLLLIGMAIGVAFFAEQIPFLIELTKPADLKFATVDYPVAGLESAKVTIDWTSAPGYLDALDDSTNLIEANIAYRGELAFDVDTQWDYASVVLDSYLQGVSYGAFNFDDEDVVWDVKLSPNVALDLWLDSGSGKGDFDLTKLNITHFELDSGSGSVRLRLPERSNFEGKIDSGSGALTLLLPDDVGMRIVLDDGSGAFHPDGRFELISGERDDDGIWETENYDTADYKIDLDIDQGSGSIRIQ